MIHRIRPTSFFIKQWLMHALIAWLAVNMIDVINFLLKAETGMTLVLPDGSAFTVGDRIIHNLTRPIWLPVLLGTLVIEVNYHLIFQQKKPWIFIGTSLLCALLCTLFFWAPHVWQENFWRERTSAVVISGLLSAFGLLFLYTLLYTFTRDYIHTRIHTAEKKFHRAQAELAALKAQINPHFLFNTLNNIYGTALEEKAERAAELIERLSGLMRYVVSGSQTDFITVSEEIKFVEEYLALQRVRIPRQPNIKIVQQVVYDGNPTQIAPLLLIPFLENAFHYGISIDHECDVSFCLTVKERRLSMLITNRLLPSQMDAGGHGTGIRNASRQLELIYPNRHQLKITRSDEKFMVDLKIDLNETQQ